MSEIDNICGKLKKVVDSNEEEILKSKDIKEKVKKGKDKLDDYSKGASSSLMQEFVKDLNCSLATDLLASDVNDWYPFNCAPLDIVFGGGIPSGKILECYGWESSGKSTSSLEASKAFTRYWASKGTDNYIVLWIESESALDKVRAEYIGCDLSRFAIVEADTVESGFGVIKQALEKALTKGLHLFVCWDTIAAVATENEKVSANSGGMGEKARIIRFLLRDISTLLGKTNSTLLFVNQMYKTFSQYAEDQVPGGGGIKFHASIRYKMSKHAQPIEEVLPNGNKIIKAIDVDLFTKKNKLTLPNQTCKLIINVENGLDVTETVAKFLTLQKYIVVKGSWKFIEYMDEEIKYQNSDGLKEILAVKKPELKEYMDYLCYRHFASISPLMKVKLLDKIWTFESKLFGSKQTKITGEEYSLATLLGKSILEEQDKC